MTLRRAPNPMPDFVRDALAAKRLTRAYEARPAYQRNDYLWWISSAKREATRQKRLTQMLDKLKRGDVYMKTPWSGGR
jgi:uncharacterized protein YdeI (YjbR/CyaY-like superfamily)